MVFRQLDFVDPVIFLFLVIYFAETLEAEWIGRDLKNMTMYRRSNPTHDCGQLIIHDNTTYSEGLPFKPSCILYVVYGDFVFESREKLIQGLAFILFHFDWFGLEIHVGSGTKIYKSKCILFPPA